jgi:hypothetical protein
MTVTLSDYDTCDAQHDLDNLDNRDGCDVHGVPCVSDIHDGLEDSEIFAVRGSLMEDVCDVTL